MVKKSKSSGIDKHAGEIPLFIPADLGEIMEWLSAPGYAAVLVRVTPTLAYAILKALNLHNRDLITSRVAPLVCEMEKDAYIPDNGDTIRFGIKEKAVVLLDGQNRLMALYLTNKTFDMFFVRGVPLRAQHTIDIGTKRNFGDAMRIDKLTNTRDRSTIASKILDPSSSVKYSIAEKRNYYNHIVEPVEFALKYLRGPGHIKGICQATVYAAIAHAWYYYDDKEKLIRFCDVLRNGMVGSDPGEKSVIRLRDVLLRGKKGTRVNPTEVYLTVQRTLQAMMAGQELKNAVPATSDLFPLPEINPQTGIRNGATNKTVHHFRTKYPPSRLPKRTNTNLRDVRAKIKELRSIIEENTEAGYGSR